MPPMPPPATITGSSMDMWIAESVAVGGGSLWSGCVLDQHCGTRDKPWDSDHCEDGSEIEVLSRHFGNQKRPGDPAEPCNSEHPRNACRATLGRIVGSCQRGHRGLRRVHENAG